jgi:Family of unknown function (DUF6461)
VPGLTWLGQEPGSQSFPGCMTFVHSTDERAVLAGFGVDPDAAIPPTAPEFSSTLGITLVRSGDWLVALEIPVNPRGIRPEVLQRLSVGAEVVVIFEDIAKGNHEFAHAANGEIVTAVTTSVPPQWRGTQPDLLRPLAEELGLTNYSRDTSGRDPDLLDIQILLVIGETTFGLSLDEADLNRPLLKVPDQPVVTAPRPSASAAPVVVRSERIRPHVQELLDSGVTVDAIAAQIGHQLSTNGINNMLRGANFLIPVRTAERILAIEVPPNA